MFTGRDGKHQSATSQDDCGFKRSYQWKIIFFIIHFYAIMHRTIVQNKIISIICSCPFFCPANIYRPGLRNLWLGRPNPHPTTTAQFLSQKKNILLRIVSTTNQHIPIFNFHLFKKIYLNFLAKNLSKVSTT